MRIITQTLKNISLGAIALSVAVGCAPQDDPEPVVAADAVVESIVASDVTPTSATATITFKDAETVYFAYYASTEAANEPSWQSIDVITSQTTTSADITNLTPGIEYTLEAYAVNKDEKESESITSTFKTVQGPSIVIAENPDVTTGSITLEVTVTNGDRLRYAHFAGTTMPETPAWTEVDAEEVNTVEIIGLTPETEYSVIFKALNTSANIESAVSTAVVTTIESSVDVVATAIKPSLITLDLTLDTERANLFGYFFTDGQFGHVDNIIQQVENKSVLTSDKSFTYTSPLLSQSLGYKFFTVPLEVNEDGSYTMLEQPVEYSYVTPAFSTYGESTESFTAELAADQLSINAAKISLTASSDKVLANIYGYIKVSELDGEDVESWITENEWLSKQPVNSLWGSTTADIYLSNLDNGTDYIFFVFALDTNGDLSDPTTVEFTTKPVISDNTTTMTVEVTGTNYLDVNFDVTFNPAIAKYVYLNSTAEIITNESWRYKTEAQARTELINKAYDPYGSGIKSDNSNIVENVYDLRIEGLLENTDYILYYCALTTEGKITDLQKVTYSTKELLFNSAASVDISLVSAEAKYEEYFGETHYSGMSITLDVTMENGATSYIIGAGGVGFITDPSDLSSWGKYILLTYSGGNITHTEDGEITHPVTLYSADDRLIIVPVDADGAYGTPVLYEYEGEWPEIN